MSEALATGTPSASVALVAATRRLAEAGIPDAARDARRLLAHALDVPPARLTLVLPDPMPADASVAFEALIARRAAREPVSHLVGHRAFYGRDFEVTSDVLDPRPETETLIETALSGPVTRLLDLGTGSGCILLTLLAERPAATGVGSDLSEAALAVACRNRDALGLSDRATLCRGSWYEALRPGQGGFDLIISNPPYIARDEMAGLSPEVREHEPRMALTDESDGLAAYRAIAAGAAAHLAPGGRLLVEIGPTQGAAVSALFDLAGLSEVSVVQDLDGRDRVVGARLQAL